MRHYGKYFWRPIPFLRLLIPLTVGILTGFYFSLPFQLIAITAVTAIISLCIIYFFLSSAKYTLRWLNGLLFNLLLFCTGAILIYFQNIEHNKNWIGHFLQNNPLVIVTLQEPLTEKANSYKALAKAEAVMVNDQWETVRGNVLVYFKKDSTVPALQYGSELIIQKKLQPITNSGNPGGFNYKQYCAFQDIHYQVYLQPKEYLLSDKLHKNIFTELLINMRTNVLSILRKYIPGEKETGVAEALLIGYRDDLDKDLVQSYSNTGVVHIIAISGLHLGMIYGLMILLLKPFRKLKWIRWIKPLLILLVLWGFSLLAGAVASILRSAVMFSFIAIGESLERRTNIYNTLAASAFCLLVYNPYFFWDVGFQLSYAAVLSIVLFMKPIYKLCYFSNKLLNSIWQLNAVTLSAQILTLPIILYYFHQFPNLFLFTNFIAVPLSGFILYGELLLLIVAKLPIANELTGKLVSILITQMNNIIERTDRLPFAVTDNIQVNLWQTVILYLTISFLAWWLLLKKSKGLLIGLVFIVFFVFLRGRNLVQQQRQHKLIVYNIPQHQSIDILEGNTYRFIGDTILLQKGFLRSFHLQPSRILHGVHPVNTLPNTIISDHMIVSNHLSVLIIDKSTSIIPVTQRIPVDIIIISGSPNININQLAAAFDCQQYIFDSSNPLWKIRYWKKDAENLHLRHHTTSEQGAFEVAL
jgi:competence protein ComEC